MLTFRENWINFFILSLASRLNFLPIIVDRNSGRIRKQRSKTRKILWWLVYLCALLNLVYIAFRLGQTVLLPKYFSESHLSIELLVLIRLSSMYFMGYSSLIKNFNTNIIVFNHVFLHTTGGTWSSRWTKRPWTKYSRQELLAISLGPSFYMGLVCYMLFLAIDKSHRYLIFSALPLAYQKPIVYYLLLIPETFLLGFSLTLGYFCLIIQLLVFLKCEVVCIDIAKRHSGWFIPSPIVMRAISELRQLITFIRLFNQAHKNVVYAFKMSCTSLVIHCTTFSIRRFSTHPVLATFNVFIALEAAIIFSILYEKAFHSPTVINGVKNQILMKSQKTLFVSKRMFVQRTCLSIPNIGIQEGSFRTLERVSTPNFIHFCGTQTASLLIALW